MAAFLQYWKKMVDREALNSFLSIFPFSSDYKLNYRCLVAFKYPDIMMKWSNTLLGKYRICKHLPCWEYGEEWLVTFYSVVFHHVWKLSHGNLLGWNNSLLKKFFNLKKMSTITLCIHQSSIDWVNSLSGRRSEWGRSCSHS